MRDPPSSLAARAITPANARGVAAMWGTIARMRLKPGSEDFLRVQFHSMRNAERMGGSLFSSLFRSDTDPHELWMLAMFTDKAGYRRNAESAAQHQVYLMIRSALEEDPEWHDVDEIDALFAEGFRGWPAP